MEALLDLQAGDPYLLLNIHLPPAIWRIAAAAAMDLAVLSDVTERGKGFCGTKVLRIASIH